MRGFRSTGVVGDPRGNRRRPRGFTLVEVLVSLAIMVMIVAVITPNLIGYLDRTRVDQGMEAVESLYTGITSFYANVNRYPSELSHLSTPITTTDLDSCGSTYAQGRVNGWNSAGPFINRIVGPNGVPIFIGTAQNALIRTQLSGNTALLAVRVLNVRQEDVLEMDRRLDGDGSATTGGVQWEAAAGGLFTMHLLQVISGC